MNNNLKKLEKELVSLGNKEVFSRPLAAEIREDLFSRIDQTAAPRVTIWQLPKTIISIPATILTMVLVFLVGVATTSVASNARPGELLWQVRKLAESSDILLTFDQELKAEKQVAIANERIRFLAEAKDDDKSSLESVLQETRLALANATKAVAESENATLLANVRDLVAQQESLLTELSRTADAETRERLAMVSQEIKELQQGGLGEAIATSDVSEPDDEEKTTLTEVATVFEGYIGTAYGKLTLFTAESGYYMLVTNIRTDQLIGQDNVLIYGTINDEDQLVAEKIFIDNKLLESSHSAQEG